MKSIIAGLYHSGQLAANGLTLGDAVAMGLITQAEADDIAAGWPDYPNGDPDPGTEG